MGESIAETMLLPGETMLLPGETMLGTASNQAQNAQLQAGQTIAKNYIVVNDLQESGTQSKVYVVRREGRDYVVKLYHPGYQPDMAMVESFQKQSSPYVTPLREFGYENGQYFEIYEYYQQGTLEKKGKCSLSYLKDVVIPNLNEGLHFLHTFGGGIVHGDIKPSNIFVSNDESRVIIGDFGISDLLDKDGKVITATKGTPEYAPRTISFFGSATKTPSYDYGALGLVLIKLATGHSLFEGLSIDSITRQWEAGLVIPTSIEGRLRRLIEGLLLEDEQKRFGYEDVQKWCQGDYVKVSDHNLYTQDDFGDTAQIEPMFYGIIDEKPVVVSTLEELAKEIATHWDYSKSVFKRKKIYMFLEQFKRYDDTLVETLKEFAALPNEDDGLFRILYRLQPNPHLIYKGVDYGTATMFIQSLRQDLTLEQERIVSEGLLEVFLRSNGFSEHFLAKMQEVINMSGLDGTFSAQVLSYLFDPKKELEVNGEWVTSVEGLVEKVVAMDAHGAIALAQENTLWAWLYSMGYEKDVKNAMQ